jgi:signal transduction histidine kinase
MAANLVNILLVEDSPSDAVLLTESLAEGALAQFNFTVVESWAEAEERLQQGTFDVLLLDLSLPDVSGRETFLRARAEAPHLAIVVMTGVDDESLGLEAVRQGIQDYLIKGQAYGRQTARAIRYAIERKRAEEALKRAESSLQQERDSLELRVQERTAELQDANLALQAQIRQREQAEDAHRQLQRRLAEAQETERGRISRELHDRLGQGLTALSLGLQVVRKQSALTPTVQAGLTHVEQLARGLMRDIHRLAWELRPTALDDLGLDLALERYASEWSASTSVPVDFHCQGTNGRRLPLEVETVLYRVAQEALTNVLRHAQARRVSVLLERRGEEAVALIIEDNGCGFDAEALMKTPDSPGKLGLLGMQERVKLLGGSFELESSPGAGTTLFVRLALEPAAQPAATEGPDEKIADPAGGRSSNRP